MMQAVDEFKLFETEPTRDCGAGTNPTPGIYRRERFDTADGFEPLLSAEEAAGYLRIHVKTLQKLARERRVPCVRMGKYWRFRLSALDAWVTAQHNQIQPAVFA
jgi:excisionase family DNA binding protein